MVAARSERSWFSWRRCLSLIVMPVQYHSPMSDQGIPLPDEIWAALLDLGMKMGGGLAGTVRLLDGTLFEDMIVSNRGFILGREAPGLAGAQGAIDSSMLNFKSEDIE